LTSAAEAEKMVNYWADQGATSFKAYERVTRAQLSAIIAAAHRRGLKVTGHLCAVGFREAAALGIDNLEHGIFVDSEFVAGKQPDVCPTGGTTYITLAFKVEIESAPVQELIRDLVKNHVAITSTLAVLETFVPNRPPQIQAFLTNKLPQQRILDAMSAEARLQYLTARALLAEDKDSFWPAILKKEMQFELAFAKAGGLLLAGSDPTGRGGVVAGFANHRQVELLVEAGFTPVEAIRIATANGAQYLGLADRIGTVAIGKQADLVVIKGDPARNISDIENVEMVFKDGIAYDSNRLIESVQGCVGLR
ncbi:MAG: amidohydrolase family protein, partial [Acidobacteriota bacterium]